MAAVESPHFFVFGGAGNYRDAPVDVTHLVVDSSVAKIPWMSFAQRPALIHVTLYEGLRFIEKYAFRLCSSLTTIMIPSTLESIDDYAFEDCISLRTVELNEGLQWIGCDSFSKCTSLTTLTTPSTLVSIGARAFMSCTSLATLKIQTNIAEIGDSAFMACDSLVDVTLLEGLSIIGNKIFSDCQALRNILIPSTVKWLGESAFASCGVLSYVHLQEGLRVIGELAFSSCTALVNILIPSTVERIEREAFAECTSLLSVEMSTEGQMELEMMAFSGCTFLKNIGFSAATSGFTMGSGVFGGCAKLEDAIGNGESVIVNGLQHRFDDLHVHKLCYYQAFQPDVKNLEDLRQIIESNPNAHVEVDVFGMTPLHILALSTEPNCFLFSELLMLCPKASLSKKDKWNKSPLYYLCSNGSPDSSSLIKILIQVTVRKRIKWLGLEQWRMNASVNIESLFRGENPSVRIEALDELESKLSRCEWMEAVSLLEEAVWKATIDEILGANLIVDDENSSKRIKIDRQACRISCGAEIIVPNVLFFLGTNLDFAEVSSEEGDGDSEYSSD